MGMARLIDAKALEKQIKEAFEDSSPVLMGQLLRWVRKQSTIDATEVVRCKDCKHRTEMANCGHPRQDGILPTAYPLDFCSYGERKDND